MRGRKSILVVEDDPEIRDLVELALRDKGYLVFSTDNGQRALTFIRVQHPDLVILDLMLPGAHGFSVCRTVKEDEQLKTIKILIFSAKAYPADREMAFAVGADAYLVKSDLFQVIEQVEVLIGRPETPDREEV